MPPDKEQILDILRDGQKNANKLPDSSLKKKIISLFNRLEKLIEVDMDFSRIGNLAKRLSISVLDALNFKDLENLQEDEMDIRNEIEVLDK